jgi:uncharacterized membrane protein
MRHRSDISHSSRRLTFASVAAGLACLLSGCSDATPVAPTLVSPAAAVADAAIVAGPTVVAIGNVMGYGVNDLGTIVGPSDGNKSSAYLWDASVGLKLLGNGGIAWDLSQDGHAVGGQNGAGKPVLWTAASVGAPRTEVALPDAGNGGAVRAMVSDATGAPVLMTGNVFTNGTTKTPAKWTPCTAGAGCMNGWLLTTVPLTAPVFESWGQDMNPSGMIVGMEGTNCCRAEFWDVDGTQTILAPIVAGAAAAAWGINDAGTMIVGQSNSIAVMWLRASTAVPFSAPTRLESTACKGGGTSIARAMNPDLTSSGTIVGQACGNPVAWKVDISGATPTIQRIALPSTGRSTAGIAESINRSTSSSYRIAGQVNGTGVYWTNF